MTERINAIIRLRRDNDYNFENIKNTFIPANGEVILVDTATTGLRAKVGDGYSTYAQLQYEDMDLRSPVQQGYYNNGVFYRDPTQHTIAPAMINKIYIDLNHSGLYFFNGNNYILLNDHTFPTATAQTAGMVKLYATTGQNTDGTMTQKAITDELDLRFTTSVNDAEEMIIFSKV